MKHDSLPLLLALVLPLLTSCESAAMRGRTLPATLVSADAQCRAQINVAVSDMTGQPLTLAEDTFVKSDVLVLSTVGQSASGRMVPPTLLLRLQRSDQGCQLQFEGREKMRLLPACQCRSLPETNK